jgi:protein TonB
MDANTDTHSRDGGTVIDPTATSGGFYLHKEGVTYGPELLENLQALWTQGWVQPDDLLWKEGDLEWVSAESVFASEETREPLGAATLGATEPDPEENFAQVGAVPFHPERSWPWGSFGIALTVHLAVLLAILQWLHLFPVRFDAYTVPPSQEPPLEVAMVPEEQPVPPPPPPDPTPPDPTPPPPPPPLPLPDLPPPPPAPAEMPLPSIPPPPSPAESEMLREIATTPLPPPKPVHTQHKIAKAQVNPPLPVRPSPPPPAETGEPEYLANPRPVYPMAARLRHQQGTVLLLVTLDADGNPSSVSIEQSSGYGILDQAALKKVSTDWRFKPGQSSTVHVPVEFHLED